MNYYLFPPLFSFLFLIFLSAFSLRVSREKKSVLFALIAFLGAIHNLDKAVLTVVEDPGLALSISRWDHALFVFIAPIFIHFVYAFLGKKEDFAVYGLYAFSFLISPFTQTALYIKSVKKFFFGYFAQAGPLLILFFLVSLASFFYSILLLVRGYRTSDKVKKERIRFVLVGFGIASFLSHGDILLTLGVSYYPLGNFSFIPIAFLFYGLFKYDILDVGFIRKSVTYTLFTFTIAVLYFVVVFLIELVPFVRGSNPFVVAFSVTILLVFVVEPLKSRMREFVDRLFFRGKFLYTEVLEDLLKKLSTVLDLDMAVSEVRRTLERVFRPDRVVVAAWDGYTLVPDSYGSSFSELLSGLGEDWEFKRVIRFGDEKLGVLCLGKKEGFYPYTQEELRFLELISEQLSVVFKNGKSFRELQRINQELERRVEERTKEIKRLLEEKERQYQLLLQSESLANIGRLAAGVAHEINNPITTVRSLLQLMMEDLEKGDLPREAKEDLEFCLRELDRIQSIIRSLLDVSRVGVGSDGVFDVSDAVEDAVRVMRVQFRKKGVELVTSLKRGFTVKGEKGRLAQVVINLLSNALDASQEGGVVEVGVDDMGDKVRLWVKDEGCGIPEDVGFKVFSPFFTTKPPGKGTGLGLYISYEIIKSMKGNIYFRSSPGKGTVFFVELPKA